MSELFSSFEVEPLASASVAQVHEATMFDGRDVVVKVIRPGISKTIRKDVDLLLPWHVSSIPCGKRGVVFAR